MHLSLDDFCEVVKKLKRTNAEKALAVLWFHDQKQADIAMSAGELTRILGDHHIGTANSTALGRAIAETKLASESRAGFSLKPGSRRVIQGWLPADLDGIQPTMDQAAGYLPEAVWRSTRGYIEGVCRQLNGCFKFAYYDAAAVMLRRLLETLIIEAYEHLKREGEIKDGGGQYLMLRDLVERACGEKGHPGLNLGRDSKSTLKDARDIGNWSAHARRYTAVSTDLTKIQAGVRVAVQELIHLANLKRP
jgi:hypothetical protein